METNITAATHPGTVVSQKHFNHCILINVTVSHLGASNMTFIAI